MILIVQYNTLESAGYFTKILDRLGKSYKVVDLEKGENLPTTFEHTHLICMGGYDSVYDDLERVHKEEQFIKESIERDIPYFGVCLGMQFLAKIVGAEVKRCEKGEHGFGSYKNFIVEEDAIFEGLEAKEFHNFQIHNDCVTPNEHLKTLCKGSGYKTQMVKHKENCYGIQGHVEIEANKLALWLENDKELQKLDKEKELARYSELKSELEKLADVLIGNFLKL